MPRVDINFLFFGHSTINDRFQNNAPLEDVVYDLVRGNCDVEPLRVRNISGKFFVVDGNRRLFVLRHIRSYLNDPKVRIVFSNHHEDRVMVHHSEGQDVAVRGRGTHNVRAAIIEEAERASNDNYGGYY